MKNYNVDKMLKKKLFKQKLLYILYNVCILSISAFVNKFLQMALFIFFFEFIQNCFKKRFHTDTIQDDPIKAVRYCKIITVVIEVIFLVLCNSFDISIYKNIFEIFIIAAFNSLLQVFFENAIVEKEEALRDKDRLLKMCKEAGIKEEMIQRMIWKYVENKTYEEIASIEHVELDTVKQSIRRARRKLNIRTEMS